MADRPLSIDIRHPLMLKSGDLTLLTREDGEIVEDVPGLGLFFRDTCYLAAYALRLHGTAPMSLMASASEGIAAQLTLTNHALNTANGQTIPDHTLTLRRTFLVLDDDGPTWTDMVELTNSGENLIELPLTLTLCTRFESMFHLRGAPPGKRGTLHRPALEDNALRFVYDGADDVRRTLLVGFSLPAIIAPRTTESSTAHFDLSLRPLETVTLVTTLRVDERGLHDAQIPARKPATADTLRRAQDDATRHLLDGFARIETPSEGFGQAIARSLSDLALLNVQRGPHRFTAAGVPWFVGLFGRDSLLPTLQCLALNPALGAHTTRALAHRQGSCDDDRTMEQPGKILHELRVGEMTHLREVTQTPSYAAVDSTLLFLIAIARHVAWTGDLALFDELRPNVDAALAWLERKTAENEAGWVTYDGIADAHGQPINQSWRDSGTGVLSADGTYPKPPLALVEVQGYAFQARVLMAGLFRRSGDADRASSLEAAAGKLRARFLREFWMEDEGCYALALQADGSQVASVTSNAAQVLWTGIATPEHAARTAERIMRPDMFSGWGVRTLSSDHPRFDPLAYQQGSVWPFDTSLIVAGLRQYAQDDPAARLVRATMDAASCFRLHRLPEFIAGTQRRPGDEPVHTPRADPMQAWSAAALPFMLTTLLGLQIDGFERRVTVRRPMLPPGVQQIRLADLEAGGERITLDVTAAESGRAKVAISGTAWTLQHDE
ncbi:MAG: amylo-alpha-1,6-glucosidase [Janthinobacterium lividum]